MTDHVPARLDETPARAAPGFIDIFERAIAEADRQRAALAADLDLEALAHAVPQLDALKRSLAMLRDAVAHDVIGLLGSVRTKVLDGLGTLEIYPGAPRKEWDTERLFELLLDRALHAPGMPDDLADTHVLDPDGVVICSVLELRERLVDALQALPLTKSLGWRSGKLAERGVDARDFRRTEPGSPRLVFSAFDEGDAGVIAGDQPSLFGDEEPVSDHDAAAYYAATGMLHDLDAHERETDEHVDGTPGTPPRARVADPETSHDAAVLALPRASSMRRRIVDELSAAELTSDEIAERFGIFETSQRCSDLMRDGWLEPTGETRITRRGSPSRVLRLTARGRARLEQ